ATPGGQIAALQGAVMQNRFGGGIHPAVSRQPLDGSDLLPRRGGHAGRARADWLAVDKHGASAATPFAAAVLAAREVEILPQDLQQAAFRIGTKLTLGAVHMKLDHFRHKTSSK